MALDFFSEFNGIVRALQGTRIRYAVMGGVAVAIHGGLRSTKDIDFMVHPDDNDAFGKLLKSLGFMSNRGSLIDLSDINVLKGCRDKKAYKGRKGRSRT
jgi:hypothetical protein